MVKLHISRNNSAVLLLMTETVNNDDVAYFATKIVSVNMLPSVYFVRHSYQSKVLEEKD